MVPRAVELQLARHAGDRQSSEEEEQEREDSESHDDPPVWGSLERSEQNETHAHQDESS